MWMPFPSNSDSFCTVLLFAVFKIFIACKSGCLNTFQKSLSLDVHGKTENKKITKKDKKWKDEGGFTERHNLYIIVIALTAFRIYFIWAILWVICKCSIIYMFPYLFRFICFTIVSIFVVDDFLFYLNSYLYGMEWLKPIPYSSDLLSYTCILRKI